MYGLGVVGLGLSAAPLFAYAMATNPSIIISSLGLTTAIFGGASYAAYSMPRDSMIKYGRVLGGSLLGLIGLQLIGLASTFIIGPNPYTLVLFKASNYISVALFTAFIAYDTHISIKMYESGVPDHLGMASNFILDFWNILTALLRIFSSD
jgi:FtsH-binding integral membrane protein